jgi:hypothetical protein
MQYCAAAWNGPDIPIQEQLIGVCSNALIGRSAMPEESGCR